MKKRPKSLGTNHLGIKQNPEVQEYLGTNHLGIKTKPRSSRIFRKKNIRVYKKN